MVTPSSLLGVVFAGSGMVARNMGDRVDAAVWGSLPFDEATAQARETVLHRTE